LRIRRVMKEGTQRTAGSLITIENGWGTRFSRLIIGIKPGLKREVAEKRFSGFKEGNKRRQRISIIERNGNNGDKKKLRLTVNSKTRLNVKKGSLMTNQEENVIIEGGKMRKNQQKNN